MVGVVILNWNGLDKTIECVKSLLASDYSKLKVFVVDNGSKNDEAGQLRTMFGHSIEVIANAKNLGVAGGNNSGLQQVLADPAIQYALMMNNDLVVEPQAVSRLVSAAEVNSSIGMVASRMMNYYHRDQIDNLGIAMTSTGLGYNRKSEFYPLFCPCSGFGLYRTKALRAIGMPDGTIWDNEFFAYVDEVDVGFRLRLHGFTAVYSPEAVAYHMDGATSGGATSPFSIYHGHRNNVWFITKDFPAALFWKNFFGIMATQFGTFFLYAKRGKLKLIFKAKFDALKKLPLMLQRRRFIQKTKGDLKEIEKFLIHQTYLPPEALAGPATSRGGASTNGQATRT